MKRLLLAILIFNIIIPSHLLFAQREPKPNVKIIPLTDHFYKLYVHEFVNMLVFTGPEGVLLVDSGLDPINLIQDALKDIEADHIRYIINTHSNGDHILGNRDLGQNATIISSSECRLDMEKREEFPESGLPNLTFKDSMTIHFNDEEINLIFLPGHTGNDIVVHFKYVKIVCIGDLVFSDSFPSIQTSRGGNVFTLEKSIGKLLRIFPKDVTFNVSHIRDYTWDDLKVYHEMIQKTIAIVTEEIKKGKNLEAIQESNPLKDWESWNSDFFPGEITTDTWIENIYESVQQKD